MKTIFVKPDEVEHKWCLIDAEGKVLGRLASRVVAILRGKNKPEYAPHWDMGDSVVIIKYIDGQNYDAQIMPEVQLIK